MRCHTTCYLSSSANRSLFFTIHCIGMVQWAPHKLEEAVKGQIHRMRRRQAMKEDRPTGDAKLDDLTNHVDQIMRRQDLGVNSPRRDPPHWCVCRGRCCRIWV